MGNTQRVIQIDPSLLVSKLTVGEFIDIIATTSKGFQNQAKKRVDFTNCGPGQTPLPIIKCDDVQFSIFPAGTIVEKQIVPEPPARFLEVVGIGMVQIDFPCVGDVELHIANLGGNLIQVDFFDDNAQNLATAVADPKEVIQELVYTGPIPCCHIRVNVNAAECYIRRLCYLA
ncbi:MAG: hypothetical protein JXR84_23025 [Anaerolineae bacterium]|nr:hypothetical protein [Anaerolineae bacterium]